MLLHNYVFGEKALVPFVYAHGTSRLFVHPYEYLSVYQNNENYSKIIVHLKNLLTTGNYNIIVYFINSIFLINLIVYYVLNFKKFNNYNVFICLISLMQITRSFFYINTNRYAYFSWLLITLSNLLIIREYCKNFKKIY